MTSKPALAVLLGASFLTAAMGTANPPVDTPIPGQSICQPGTDRPATPVSDAPYNAIAHMNLEGEEAATLFFGPSSDRVLISAAHVFNTITYGDDTTASYSDDRGNTANIIALYLPDNYDAVNGDDRGIYADKAIVVLDRSIPGAGRLDLNIVDKDSLTALPVMQAGYPFDSAVMRANCNGSLTGVQYRGGAATGDYLFSHDMRIIPGDSGSPAWNRKGIVGIVQSNNHVTPITPQFIAAYNDIVAKAAATPTGNAPAPEKLPVFRIKM